jgi:cytochrome c biogenesis protein CcdA
VLAAGAGVASFFSPCVFPLLLTMLARAGSAEGLGPRGRFRRTVVPATAHAEGAGAFVLIFGALVAPVGGAVFEQVTFTSTAGRLVRLIVGVSLVVLGLVQLERLPILLRQLEPATHGFLRRQARLRRRRPVAGYSLFGYLLAGFG